LAPTLRTKLKNKLASKNNLFKYHHLLLQKEIYELKTLMEDIDKKFKDPESKNKLRNLKSDAQKQI
jgi:hypothetical protein